MLLRINTSITLATGQTGNGCVIETRNAQININKGSAMADIPTWASMAKYESGMQNSYLIDATTQKAVPNFSYAIPSEDIATVQQSNSYTIIGTNYTDYVKRAIANILSIDVSLVEIINIL